MKVKSRLGGNNQEDQATYSLAMMCYQSYRAALPKHANLEYQGDNHKHSVDTQEQSYRRFRFSRVPLQPQLLEVVAEGIDCYANHCAYYGNPTN